MAQQTINVGTAANSGNGDPLRDAFVKVNANTTETYSRIGTPAQARSYIGIPRIDVKATYGGFFDAGSHPLGNSFSSLAAAQARYPNAGISSLADETDWAAMQQACYDAAYGVGGIIGLHTGAQMVFGTKSLDIIAGNIVFLRGGPNVGFRCANLPAGVPAVVLRGVQPHEHKTSIEDISFYARNTGSFGFAPIENNGAGHTQYTAGSVALSMYDCFQVSLNRVTFNGFDRPVLNGDNLWGVLFDKCVYCNNNLGASWARTPALNSGEQIRWRDCGLNNNNWGFYLEPHILDANGGASLGGSFFLENCSVDYNQRGHGYYDGGASAFDTNNNLTIISGHMESNSAVSGSACRIQMKGGMLSMHGCLVFENGGPNTTPGLVQIDATSRASAYGVMAKGGKEIWPMFWAPTGTSKTYFVAGSGNRQPDGQVPYLLGSADDGYVVDQTDRAGYQPGGFGDTGGTLTLQAPNGIITLGGTQGGTLTIPNDTTIKLMAGVTYELLTTGSGVFTFAGASGVTVTGNPSVQIGGRSGLRCKLLKTAANTYTVFGDMLPVIPATLTATTTLNTSQPIVKASAAAGSITLNLPLAVNCIGCTITIKKVDATGNAIIIDPAFSELIDGVATISLTTPQSTVQIRCNGVSWDVLSKF